MRQRGVSEQDIDVTLNNPDLVQQTPDDSMCYSRTFLDGRALKVWVRLPELGDVRDVRSAAWKGRRDE